MGQGGVGHILELGCQGGVGSRYVGSIPAGTAPYTTTPKSILRGDNHCVYRLTDVLVGRKLSALGSRQRTYLYDAKLMIIIDRI